MRLILLILMITATAPTANANPFSEAHQSLSNRLVLMATSVDSFFINIKDVEEYNKTKLHLYQTFTKTESEDMKSRFNFRFNIHLPNLEKRFKISFERQGRGEENTLTSSGERLETESSEREEYTRGGLEYLIPRLFDFEMKLSVGVRVDIPPTPYVEYRLSRDIDLNSWLARFYANTFWSHRSGPGQSVALDFDRDLNDLFLLRLINEATWSDSDDTIRIAHGPTLYHTLSQRRMMSYSARAHYTNRPHYQLESYHLSLSYRQALSEKMLYYELIPAMKFAREHNFRSEGLLALKLELVF